MANNLYQESYGSWTDIDDQRWRKNQDGVSESGQNGSLIIDDAAKAEGGHRVGRYLLSGVPVYRDAEDENTIKVWDEAAKTAGQPVLGFLQSINKIMNEVGEFYDRIPVGIQTAGEIYPTWLPVEVADEDIPVRFGVSPL